jgi:hypothetical protein
VDLTTTARVKTLRGITTATDDTLIGMLVTAISAQVEDFLDRHAEATARTVYFDVRDEQFVFSLKGYPVSAVASVYNDSDWDFASTDLVDSDYYTVLGTDGLLRFDPAYILIRGPRALKVTYTGGMATSVTNFYAAYPQIELAAQMQTLFVYDRRKFLADTTSAVSGSSVSFQTPDLLPEVRRLLMPHRRVSYP